MLEDKNQKRTKLSDLGEFGLIEHLTKHFTINQKSTLKSIGDDAAVLDFGDKKTIVSTDLLVEGIHFGIHLSIETMFRGIAVPTFPDGGRPVLDLKAPARILFVQQDFVRQIGATDF